MLQISFWKRLGIWLTVTIGLLLAMPNAFYNRVELHNDALVEIERGAQMTPEMQSQIDGWPGFLPSALVNLGLDLRGGAHLLAEVRVEDVYSDRMDGIWAEVRNLLRDQRATIGTLRRQNAPLDELRIKLSNPDGMEQAIQLTQGLSTLIPSLSGGAERDFIASSQDGLLVVQLTEAEKLAMNDRTMQRSLEIIRRRVDEVGTREPTIQRQGDRRILIQVPGIGSAEDLKKLIGTTAKLTFHAVINEVYDSAANPGPRNVLFPDMDENGVHYIVRKTPQVSGEDLVDAQSSFDQYGAPSVTFRFNPTGARKFGIYTTENIGTRFAVVLDGEVITAPQIREPIPGGTGQITGQFTVDSANELAILLRAGALPAKMDFLEERTIGPELGQDSIDAGKIACLVAFAAVLIFMVLSYGLFGVFANIALIINVGMIFGLLSLVGATLTLPGIAGIVLTIGMAVDANVLIFERIREELKSARGPARAIELGYEKALSAILDANITTFITAVILFVMGSGPVRGFSITLGFGILTSVFTAIYVTRVIVVIWFERKRPKKIEV